MCVASIYILYCFSVLNWVVLLFLFCFGVVIVGFIIKSFKGNWLLTSPLYSQENKILHKILYYCFHNTLQLKLYLLCNILHLFSVLVLFQVHIFHVINVENSIIELFLLSKSSVLIKRQLLSDRECFCPHIHQWHTSCISVLIYDQR